MVVSIKVHNPWFNKLKNGEKKVEGRKYDSKYEGISEIEFECDGEVITKKVVTVKHYETLYEYLNEEKYNLVLPGVTSLENAINIYLSFKNNKGEIAFSDENIKKAGGFTAIHIE
jgi:ASC-1-like (ASCH) protein